MRQGVNIRKRPNGLYEARYIKSKDENGKALWGYCYGKTYEIAEAKRNRILMEGTKIKGTGLLILGAGSHGHEVYELCSMLRCFEKISFLDDSAVGDNIIGTCAEVAAFADEYSMAIAAVGDDCLRLKWIKELNELGYVIPTLIHPNASVSSGAVIGTGTVVCAGATVAIGARVGRGCIIDSGVVVEKNAEVPDWTWIDCGTIVRAENTAASVKKAE